MPTITPPAEAGSLERPDRQRAPAPGTPAPGTPASPACSVDDGRILLRLARAAVEATAADRIGTFDASSILPVAPSPSLLAPSAAFVTLREQGELRGCVGNLAADRPLWRSVVAAAISVASRDPRFPPVAADEVPSLSIDVSVLAPAVRLSDPLDFDPGIDGLIVEHRGRRGLLLPEVATEQGWGAREMLAATCWKAGLPMSAWRDPETRVSAFRTLHLSDADVGWRVGSR